MSRYFTKDHEWIEVEGDTGTVGITDYAQGQLGDITYVELPANGQDVKKGDSVAVVDSVKAASDVGQRHRYRSERRAGRRAGTGQCRCGNGWMAVSCPAFRPR